MQIFAAKHTFVRNARLRSIIVVGWAALYGTVESLPTICRDNRLVTAEGAAF